MNCLSLMLNRAAQEGKFGYHPHCSDLRITHLCFADDLLIFTDGSLTSVAAVLDVLEEFKRRSGLGLNLSKTSLVAAGVDPIELHRILDSTGISLASLPFQYLGVPLCPKKLSLLDCAPLIQRIKGKVSTWSVKSLSYAGRLQLLQSVINGITNYWTTAFILPKKCITTINSICSAFLWTGTPSNHHGAKVSWASITVPKVEGGLGLRELEAWNKACALKLLWLILFRRNSLWVAWVTKTILGGDIHRIWTVRNNQKFSWMNNKLIKWRDCIIPWTQMEVGNGAHTRFWSSPWSPYGRLDEYLSSVSASVGIPKTATLKDLWRGDSWRLPPARCDKLVSIHVFLSTITLSNEDDSYVWKVNEKLQSSYSTGAIYSVIKHQLPAVSWQKIVWASGAIPRHCFLTWLMILNRSPTRDRLLSWGLTTSPKCLLCDLLEESRDHLYFECEFSRQIWETVCLKLRIPPSHTWFQTISFLESLPLASTSTSLIIWAWQAVIYFIWAERNSRLHRQSSKPPHALLLPIDSVIRNRASSLRSERPRFASAILQQWISGGPLSLPPRAL